MKKAVILFISVFVLIFNVSAQELPVFPNGDMSSGDGIPEGWSAGEKDTENGEITVEKDMEIFASAPAALKITASGNAKGKAVIKLDDLVGRKFGLTAKVRGGKGLKSATLAFIVQGAEPAWRPVYAFGATERWENVSKVFDIPDTAESLMMLLLVEGNGSAWVDDLEIVSAESIKADPVIGKFSNGFLYSFLGWDKKTKAEGGGVHIKAKDGRGGGGINPGADVSAFAEWVPQVTVIIHPGNKAKGLRLGISDPDGTGVEFNIDLPETPGEHRLTPKTGASILEPDKAGKPGEVEGFDLKNIANMNIVGNWKGDPVDITVLTVEMVKPTEQMLAAREANREKKRKAAERRKKQEEERLAGIEKMLSEGAEHKEDGPYVVHTYAAAPDIIAVAIQEKTLKRYPAKPYVKEEGDEITGKDKNVPAWRDGKLVSEPKSWELKRGRKKMTISPDFTQIPGGVDAEGQFISTETLPEVRAYLVSSTDDPAFGEEGKQPLKVSVKRKPNGFKSLSILSRVYLHLPSPLKEGMKYTVHLKGINTKEATVEYTHNSKKVLTEIVHVSHIGFRPDDPRKDARISLWLGTGGEYDPGKNGDIECALVNEADDSVVWQTTAQLRKKASDGNDTRSGKSLSKTFVYEIDFSDFSVPGTYRIWVKGVGCSYPVRINDNVWEDAVRISMQGLLSHRSGIKLPKELMGYERPRNMHPADGFKVLPIPTSGLKGESGEVKKCFDEILKTGNIPQPMPEAWGGYMDAGDWDRNKMHFGVTSKLIELYELNPGFWKKVKLVVPENEQSNNIPDILDEARYNLDFFYRLQTPEGGVRGGIESTSHPRPGEASWQESLAAGAFAPDPKSSFEFAAIGAQYALAASEFEPEYCEKIKEAAIKAYKWADSPAAEPAILQLDEKKQNGVRAELKRLKSHAALRLLKLTGDREAWHGPAVSVFSIEGITKDKLEEPAFIYARLDESLVDPELQAKAKEIIRELGDIALAFQEHNGWDLASSVPQLPQMGYVGYLSSPGMIYRTLPRAYIITGEDKYLAGAIGSCSFAAGANPDNRAYTTGLGYDPVKWPLHIDSLITGQKAPTGITIYGPGDPAANWGFEGWVYTWYVNKNQSMPFGKEWPMAEALWDIYVSPANNEYTVHQTTVRSAYTWGVLAQRGR